MIPFAVKIAWFVLALTGLVSSWVVSIPFGRAVGAMWGPLLYCVGNTLLQVVFCLGMIWRMDPFLMPETFCIAQTLLIGFATFLLTGVAGAFSMATSLAVLRPASWGDESALQWRHVFLIPVMVFPVVGTVIHTLVVLIFDSVKPTDDLHCDSTDPEWVRFLGYAGLPFIIALPCIYLSIKSIVRVYRTNKRIQRGRRSTTTEERYTPIPARSTKTPSISIVVKEPDPPVYHYQKSLSTSAAISTPSFITANEYPPSPGTAGSARFMLASQSASPAERKFHLPFRPPPTPTGESVGGCSEGTPSEGSTSDVSSTLPTFVNPDVPPGVVGAGIGSQGTNEDLIRADGANWRETGMVKRNDEIHWVRHRRIESEVGVEEPRPVEIRSALSRPDIRDDRSEVLGDMTSTGYSRYWTPMEHISQQSQSYGKEPQSLPNLAPAIWRIILFQTAFCAVQILTCISTIVDLATNRPRPTPLGTQHFALLLAAWGPVIVFGHTPAVRNSLTFWRRRTS